MRKFSAEETKLTPYNFTPEQNVLGSPVQRIAMLERESGSSSYVYGLWDCTEGEFDIFFSWEESALILEGEVHIKNGEQEFTLRPGDLVHFPKGTHCRWTIPRYLKKNLFCFIGFIMVREALVKDLDALVTHFGAYLEFYGLRPDQERCSHFLGERLERKDSVIFVVESDGVIVGFSQLYPTFSSLGMKRSWILNDLFVQPDRRGQGLASRMLDHVEEFARSSGAKGLVLTTGVENFSAQKLYEERGWTRSTKYHTYVLNF